MVIDQRNAGASVTTSSASAFVYTVDRWAYYVNAASKFTVQRTPSATETGYATRVGSGFTNYLAMTSTSAYTPSSTEIMVMVQPIEGFNFADMAWGTVNAKAVTLSFWAYSSLTGTHSGSIGNASGYSYPFSFSIPTANTWTQISVTIAGPTTSTWPTDNTGSPYLFFNMGSGSARLGTAGAWSSASYYGATGSVSVVGTNGATFYITGVQLEKGSTATSFDYRPYGTELALCQRYYQTNYKLFSSGSASNAYFYYDYTPFIVTMRATPSTLTFTTSAYVTPSGSTNATLLQAGVGYFVTYPTNTNQYSSSSFTWTASAEL
jgi:hypothetical protein